MNQSLRRCAVRGSNINKAGRIESHTEITLLDDLESVQVEFALFVVR